ncbi:glycosyltransferase family 4 protein [Magnetospira sp. QH-2]|uniref:glycosyltransferase family 4 protein n=1 Tax=Magnetospira sp. (strain QH-2) TaxID=1288970 RepID=UPI0003E81441|nr:glycosyltransferase family 4 protein [Magnetospira sp. QH-2]CCQ74924.1 putative GT4 : distantly related to GDP-Man a-mannosyltransferase [Magnetospira sp. QH-2]
MTRRIGLVLKGYPRLSETFIAQEILGLEKRGLDITLISLRHPTDKAVHPVHREIKAPVLYLPEYLYQEPLRVWRGWRMARRLPGYGKALATWWRDLKRDFSPNRVRRFGQALVLARELDDHIPWLYAHFLHTPASVTRYAATMRGLPWSVSAHAKDIWTSPDWEKVEKLADCAWLATCTEVNRAHLAALAPDPGRVQLIYHGLDLSRFPDPGRCHSEADGGDAIHPVRLLSVGRAVVKKGYDVLLRSLALLPRDLKWQLAHIGGGPERTALQSLARELGVNDRIQWLGAQPQERVIEQYRAADLFVLACRVADNGDRDGLPNVLMEAQSQRLPVVSTRVSAIGELIREDQNGLLVPSEDPQALAHAIEQLIKNPDRRQKLGNRGREVVEKEFTVEAGLDKLAARFGLEKSP